MASEPSYMVFTAVGPDRPGLVNRISSLIHEAGANLEDSRMAILGGEFALILLVAGPPPVLESIQKGIAALEGDLGLRCIAKETRAPALGDHLPYRLRVTGVDRPGIVSTVTNLLASRDVNVAALESRLTHAPLSGTALFVLEADLQVPSQLALSELRKQLSSTCEDENLDFTLEGAG